MLELIADIEILIGAIGAVVFAVSYGVFFDWRKTPAGRSLMYFVLSLIALFTLNAIGRWTGGEYWGRDIIRIAVYSTLVLTIWRLVVVLWSSWRSVGGFEITSKPPRTKP
jgi:hypothetical protein